MGGMQVIAVNGISLDSFVTKYECLDSEPIVLNTIQLADGSILKILAPYNKTTITIELSYMKQADYETFINALNSNGEQTVIYYSEKTNATKTGTFFIEPTSYDIMTYGNKLNVLKPFTLELSKLDEVTT